MFRLHPKIIDLTAMNPSTLIMLRRVLSFWSNSHMTNDDVSKAKVVTIDSKR